MASCQHCGIEFVDSHCSICGARAEQETVAHDPEPMAPADSIRPAPPKGSVAPDPQPTLRTAGLILLGAGLFVAGLITGRWLDAASPALPSTASADPAPEPSGVNPHAPDLADLPPVSAGEWYLETGANYLDAGNLAAAADNFRKAATQFEKALSEDPDNLYARSYLGLAYFYAGDVQKARTAEREVLDRDPNYLWAIFNLAWMEEATGSRDQAILLYRKYLDAAETERQISDKYADLDELIGRQIEAARTALKGFPGGIGE